MEQGRGRKEGGTPSTGAMRHSTHSGGVGRRGRAEQHSQPVKDKAELRQTAGGMRQLLLLRPSTGQQHSN